MRLPARSNFAKLVDYDIRPPFPVSRTMTQRASSKVQNMQVATFSEEANKIIRGDTAELPKSRPGIAMNWCVDYKNHKLLISYFLYVRTLSLKYQPRMHISSKPRGVHTHTHAHVHLQRPLLSLSFLQKRNNQGSNPSR